MSNSTSLSVRAFLWCVSLLALLALPCAAQSAGDSLLADGTVQEADPPTLHQYNMVIDARGHRISGIAMVEPFDDGGTVGTIVNEFGVKVLDFTCTAGRTRVLNVIGALNRWYIRRVLRRDIGIIVGHLGHTACEAERLKGRRTVTHTAGGGLTLANQRFHIAYTLTPIQRTDEPQ